MNIKEELTCKYCNEIYNKPITLNCCGENICQLHINDLISTNSSSRFTCPLCNEQNANQNFSVNKLIERLVQNELHKLEIDSEYKVVLNNLKKDIGNLETILKDPENVIYEEISELKRQVDLDRERLKAQIDTLAGGMIQQLESYEKKFKTEYKHIDLEHYKDLIKSSRKQLADFEKCLNLFSAKNEDRAKQSKESENISKILQPKIKELKDKLFSNISITYKPIENDVKILFGKIETNVSLYKLLINH